MVPSSALWQQHFQCQMLHFVNPSVSRDNCLLLFAARKNQYATYISVTVISVTSALLLYADSLPPSSKTLFSAWIWSAPALCPHLNYRCKERIYERKDGTGPHEPKNWLYRSLLSDLPQRRLFQELRVKLLFKANMACEVVILKIGYRWKMHGKATKEWKDGWGNDWECLMENELLWST